MVDLSKYKPHMTEFLWVIRSANFIELKRALIAIGYEETFVSEVRVEWTRASKHPLNQTSFVARRDYAHGIWSIQSYEKLTKFCPPKTGQLMDTFRVKER